MRGIIGAAARPESTGPYTRRALSRAPLPADTHNVSIPPVSTRLPDGIQSPADALAFIAVKKGMDAQKAAAAALLSLLDPKAGTRLDASA